MKSELSILILTILLISTAFAGCTSQPTATQAPTITDKSTAQDTGVQKLIFGTTNAVSDINVNDYYFGILRARTTHPGLITLNPNGSFAPSLAESWESPDGKKWTFHMVKNATWHDGVPLTARDIKFNLEYFPAKISEYKSHWGQIDTVEAPDDYTIVINLKTPNSNFMTNLLVMRAVPEHIFKDVADPLKYNEMNATIGSGPYRFVGFNKDSGILTFKAYEGYFGGKPSVDTIEVRLFKNQDTMIMALQKGEIDTTYMYSNGISYFNAPKLLQDEDIQISVLKSTGVTGLFYNSNKSVLNNATFRKAMSYAIDYEEVKNLFTAGYGDPGTAGFLAKGNYNYKDTALLSKDLNKSKELLDSIGMADKDGDGFREAPDGKKFQPELLTRTDIADYPRLAEMLKKYFNAVGIDLKIKLVDSTTFQQIANTAHNHDILISRTTPWGMMTWCGYGSCYVDSRNIGYTVTNDPAYTSLVDQMFNTTDLEKQKQLAWQMQDYYANQMPVNALYTADIIQPVNKKYEGWVNDPMYGIFSYGTFYELHEV